jgi:hypothetical protein
MKVVSILMILIMLFGISCNVFSDDVYNRKTDSPFDWEDSGEVITGVIFIVMGVIMGGAIIALPFRLVAQQNREDETARHRRQGFSYGEFTVAGNFVGVNLHL